MMFEDSNTADQQGIGQGGLKEDNRNCAGREKAGIQDKLRNTAGRERKKEKKKSWFVHDDSIVPRSPPAGATQSTPRAILSYSTY
jgi:hypothetical protein